MTAKRREEMAETKEILEPKAGKDIVPEDVVPKETTDSNPTPNRVGNEMTMAGNLVQTSIVAKQLIDQREVVNEIKAMVDSSQLPTEVKKEMNKKLAAIVVI